MGEPRSSSPASTSQNSSTSTATTTLPSPPPLPTNISLVQPSQKRKHKPKVIRVFRSVFRSFPIITPACKFPTIPTGPNDTHHHHHHKNIGGSIGTKISGTLFGHRKGRVSLSVQENPKCLPSLVVELSMQTSVLQKEMAAGMVRIALECEKRQEKDKTLLIEEPLWTMYCNGKKTGYGVKRDATEEDLHVMELLKAITMGAGVVPLKNEVDDVDAEVAYMRASFEHVVGSKDSETLYMLSPEGNNPGPELSIFFVRI
ncbi:protein MIZU-KUSSEI 1 [Vicia villosa]|uniref:protein MIZU-KUSSEI 1 n=1 Tax=Vicia villosa TaxID=3911 RepID=UPI00273A9A3F|nr:protein MIZU-KUSSEI 1 [Vicia villosa]